MDLQLRPLNPRLADYSDRRQPLSLRPVDCSDQLLQRPNLRRADYLVQHNRVVADCLEILILRNQLNLADCLGRQRLLNLSKVVDCLEVLGNRIRIQVEDCSEEAQLSRLKVVDFLAARIRTSLLRLCCKFLVRAFDIFKLMNLVVASEATKINNPSLNNQACSPPPKTRPSNPLAVAS